MSDKLILRLEQIEKEKKDILSELKIISENYLKRNFKSLKYEKNIKNLLLGILSGLKIAKCRLKAKHVSFNIYEHNKRMKLANECKNDGLLIVGKPRRETFGVTLPSLQRFGKVYAISSSSFGKWRDECDYTHLIIDENYTIFYLLTSYCYSSRRSFLRRFTDVSELFKHISTSNSFEAIVSPLYLEYSAARKIQRCVRAFFERPFYPSGRQGYYARKSWENFLT